MTGTRSSKLASIIISNYNSGKFLKKCLASLMNLEYPNYEVIVVDAGSTDGSPEIIKKFFPKVKLIQERRIGIGEAINIGLRKAKGEIIVFDFNSDEIATPEWLSHLVKVLDSSPRIGVVGGTRIFYKTDIVDCAGARISFFGQSFKIDRWQKFDNISKQIREVDYVPCIITKKEIVDKIGLVDEKFHIYGEDVDFCIRVRKAGYKVIQVPYAVTYHVESASVGKETPRYVYFSQRALMRLILKHFSPLRMLIGLAWIGFLTLINAMILFPPFKKLISFTPYRHWASRDTMEHFKASLSAVWWNLKNFPK